MKKLLPLILLFCLTNILAQNKVSEQVMELQRLEADFKSIAVLTPTLNVINNQINEILDDETPSDPRF